jgi:hypothetical protein
MTNNIVRSVSARKRFIHQSIAMNRFIKVLARKLSRPKAPVAADQPCNAVSAEDVLMPDIYAVKHDAVERKFEVIDQSSPDVDKSAGFNPYDTAILRKKFGPKPR